VIVVGVEKSLGDSSRRFAEHGGGLGESVGGWSGVGVGGRVEQLVVGWFGLGEESGGWKRNRRREEEEKKRGLEIKSR